MKTLSQTPKAIAQRAKYAQRKASKASVTPTPIESAIPTPIVILPLSAKLSAIASETLAMIKHLITVGIITFIVSVLVIGYVKIDSLKLSAVLVPCGTYTLDSNHAYVEITSHAQRITTITLECDSLNILSK